MGTIQRIMDNAQSQATEAGLWTDEGEESNRSFPTQEEQLGDKEEEEEEDLETAVADKAGMLAMDGVLEESKEDLDAPTRTEPIPALPRETECPEGVGDVVGEVAAAPPGPAVDVPRVSIGDTPPKGRTHASTDDALEVPAVLAPPATRTIATPQAPPLAPCPRWGHTLTSIGNHKLVLYGGQTLVEADGGSGPHPLLPTTVNDVMVYDSAEKVWFQPYNCQGTSCFRRS
jgi:Galactose oxidase, central domain